MTRTEVVRTYLELTERATARAVQPPGPGVRLDRLGECPVSFFRYLYAEVGRRYHWRDRLPWTDDEVRARVADPAVSLFLLSASGAPAGYFELEKHADGAVEIAYFGLLPEFIGRGLGRYMLTEAIAAAWSLGATRVWLHTCTLDDPAALPNYVARGFRPFRTETYEADLP
jgi:GNAT superfamily N-acetyltransferase